jgi:hypothetical protein
MNGTQKEGGMPVGAPPFLFLRIAIVLSSV